MPVMTCAVASVGMPAARIIGTTIRMFLLSEIFFIAVPDPQPLAPDP